MTNLARLLRELLPLDRRAMQIVRSRQKRWPPGEVWYGWKSSRSSWRESPAGRYPS